MKLTLENKRVLVTGGAGFIGSHLVDYIVQDNPRSLVVVDSLYLGKLSNLDKAKAAYPDLRFYQQDIADFDKMRAILEKEQTEVVFDLAVTPLPASLVEPYEMFMANTQMPAVMCELLRLGYYQTLVHFSSSEAYGTALYVPMSETHRMRPFTPYAASKSAGDHIAHAYIQTFGLDLVVVRPFNNFGPRQNEGTHAGVIPSVIRRVLAGEPVQVFGDGEQTRDYIFVRDTAEATVRIYRETSTRGKEVNVCSGREVTINTLVGAILQTMGLPDYPVEHTTPRPGDVRRHCGDPTLFCQLVGFQPTITLREGMKETVEWYLFSSVLDVPEEFKERFRETNYSSNG